MDSANLSQLYWFLPLILGLSLVSTKFFIVMASKLGFVDVPNHRSSHEKPTPRSGGLAFTLVFFVGLVGLYLLGSLTERWLLPIVVGGPLVAIVGALDDRRSLPAGIRLLTHFMAAAVSYILLTDGFSQSVSISFLPTDSHILVMLFSLLFISWTVNLFNFMDGADGLAGTQAVVVSFCSAGISYWQNDPQLFSIYSLLGFSVLGFLWFNFSPAKVFMGDCGATFLGFIFAILALMSKVYSETALLAHLILMGMFITDATGTLISRAIQKKRVYEAHRHHAFQHAMELGWSHARVSVFYNLVTLFWLGPLAIMSVIYFKLAWLFLLIAYTPLLLIVFFFKAGVEPDQVPGRRIKPASEINKN